MCNPGVEPFFATQGHNLNNIGRGSLDDATDTWVKVQNI